MSRAPGCSERARRPEVVVEETAVERSEHLTHVVGEHLARGHPVEQSRVVLGEEMLLHRRRGTAVAHGVQELAVPLDHDLLGHRRRLGRDEVVAVVRVDVQARGRHREAEPELRRLEDVARRGLVVLVPASATERVEELVAPRLLGRPRLDRLARVDQHRNLVDAAVRSPGHALDDERHRLPGVCGRLGDQRCRRRTGGVVRDELRRRGGVPIEELHLGRRVALRIDRGAERRVRHVRIAEERCDLRAGEDRSPDRVVADRDLSADHDSSASAGRRATEHVLAHRLRPVTSPS